MTEVFGQLVIEEDWIGVPGAAGVVLPGTRDALLRHVRADDSGRYRPLSGARTLPAGWKAPLGDGLDAEEAVEAVYPLARLHQRQLDDGSLRVVGIDEVLARQSGRYEASAQLSQEGRELAIRLLCGECVRVPVWQGATCAPAEIPCPEPCSVMVAFCREAALWERDRPGLSACDRTKPWAAFDEPGNELRERYLQETADVDE